MLRDKTKNIYFPESSRLIPYLISVYHQFKTSVSFWSPSENHSRKSNWPSL